jgi:co-chaperonin GroES (HSP10)
LGHRENCNCIEKDPIIKVLLGMSEMKLCGEYILLEALKNIADNSTFKLPETVKMYERFQYSKVVKVSNGEPAISSENQKKYNMVCNVGDIVMFRASSAEQIIDPFTKEEFLIMKNSDVIAVLGGK